MPSPKPVVLELSDEERRVLTGWARRRTTAQALALRSKIVLEYAAGRPNTEVAANLGVSRETVRKWRSRFAADRLEGLSDEPRPGAPRKITDEQVELVITKTLEERGPGEDTHWSTRSMAAATGMSQSAISRIWRAFGLKPHLVQTWKLSTDPQFIEKVRDVVGLYLDPPDKALVLCVDEKSQIQALDRTAPCLPVLPTTPARMTHDYVRNGTTSLFAALEVGSGSVIAQHYRRHRHQEFLRFLKVIEAAVPAGLDLHLICDNYATHKTPEVKKWLLRHPRFRLHFTPTSASWINLVERWFAELTNRKLRRSAHRNVAELEADIAPGSRPGTTIPGRSSGPRPPMRSSAPSPPTASESARQASPMTQAPERFRKITDHGVIPAPSGAGALLLHAEEGLDCLVVLGVVRPADKARLTAIVTFERCMQSVFGYPNDEAYWHDPRGATGDRPGYGFFEVLDSTWPARLIAYNRHAFPDRTPSHYAALRHYFIGCHDASGEFLAAGMKIELTAGSYAQAAREAFQRAAGPIDE